MKRLATKKVEYLLMAMEFPMDQKFLDNLNVWIGDKGDSVHMTPHRGGMHDVKKANPVDAITTANGSSENATVIGSIDGRLCDKNGNVLNDAKISNVTYLPEAKYNLFSITKLQNDGWTLGGNADAIWLSKGDIEIKFDIKIPTPKGVLYAMYHQRNTEIAAPTTTTPNAAAATVGAVIPTPKRMSVKKAHDMLGHVNEKAVQKTVTALGWELTRGTLGVCGTLHRSQGKTEKSSKASQCATIYQRRKSYLLGHRNDKENQEGTESLQRKLANYGGRTNSIKIFQFLRHQKWNGGRNLRTATSLEAKRTRSGNYQTQQCR
jgi:hypothetical protein